MAADLIPQRGRVQSQIKAESDDDKPYHKGNRHFPSECLFLRLTFLLPGLPSLMKIAALVHQSALIVSCNAIRVTQAVLVTIRCLPHDEQSPGALQRPTLTAFVCRSFSVRLARVVPNASRIHSSQKFRPGFPVRNSVARSMLFCILRR